MRITDGTRTVEIRMYTIDQNTLSPDWSTDFFDAGNLPYNPETDTYTVSEVNYCVHMAYDWEDEDPIRNLVVVE